MSRRKAFWGDAGGTLKPVPGAVNDELLDFGVNKFGVQFKKRGTGELLRFLSWAELHRISQLPMPIDVTEIANALHGELRILPVEDDGA